MKLWIILTTILVSTVSGFMDEWGLIHFSKSKKELLECLKNETDLLEVLNEHVRDSNPKTYVIHRIAHLFRELTVPAKNINEVADNFGNFLGTIEFILSNDQIKKIKKAIVDALQECSDPANPSNSLEPNLCDPPHFVQEIPELAELFNMILVEPAYYCRKNSNSSNILRFFDRTLSLIELELRRLGSAHEFTNELLRMWSRRARLYFKFDTTFHKYMIHCCLKNRVYSKSKPSSFVPRRDVNYNERDPTIGNDDGIFDTTTYHTVDWQNLTSSHVSAPNASSLTKSRDYFEKNRTKFLLKLFFYLELIEKGAPEEVIRRDFYSQFVEDMSDPIYGTVEDWIRFLEAKQSEELSHSFARDSPIFSSLVQSLQPGDLIHPIDLLMMVWHRLIGLGKITAVAIHSLDFHREAFNDPSAAGPSSSHTYTTTSTTASSSDTSTTPRYEESKRGKGQVTRLSAGKFKPKNQPSSSDDGPSSPKKSKYSEIPTDMTEELLFKKKEKISLEILRYMFFMAIKNGLSRQEGLIYDQSIKCLI